MICGFLGCTAAATVLKMYRFTAVSHGLYTGNMKYVLFTAVGRQMSGFEPSVPRLGILSAFFAFLF